MTTTTKTRPLILFLCTANAARSQMAKACSATTRATATTRAALGCTRRRFTL